MAGRQQDGEEAMVAATLGGELLVAGIFSTYWEGRNEEKIEWEALVGGIYRHTIL